MFARTKVKQNNSGDTDRKQITRRKKSIEYI